MNTVMILVRLQKWRKQREKKTGVEIKGDIGGGRRRRMRREGEEKS